MAWSAPIAGLGLMLRPAGIANLWEVHILFGSVNPKTQKPARVMYNQSRSASADAQHDQAH